jgi:hypothetical protein
MDQKPTPPIPALTGPDTPGMRRLRAAVASGKQIYPAPAGEHSVVYLMGVAESRAIARRQYVRYPAAFAFIALLILLSLATTVADTVHQLHQNHITQFEAVHYRYISMQVFRGLLGVVLMAAFLFLLVPLIFKRQLDQIGPITASLSPEGVLLKSRMAESRIYWRYIKHIERTKTHLLFWQNIFGGIVIPLWAFPDNDAAEAFYNEAKQYQETARQ